MFYFHRLFIITTLLNFILITKGHTSMDTFSENSRAVTLTQKIGQMIMVGFEGATVEDAGVKTALQQTGEGKIGGVIFFRYNIKDPGQVKALTAAFKSISSSYPLFLAIDQEGGKVQRLSSKNGFKDSPSAEEVAKTQSPEKAYETYRDMAQMIKEAGFTINFAPVVDLRGDPKDPKNEAACPVIGQLGRSFSNKVDTIVQYASTFIRAHHDEGLLTSLKHYPGHGLAQKDSHEGMVDITKTYQPIERQPFHQFIKEGLADSIMVAHLMHQGYDKKNPTTLSTKFIIPWLRQEDGFQGVVFTDDLHMGAIQQHYTLKDIIIKAIQAGNDVLVFSNNAAAAQGVKDFKPQANLADQIITIVQEAIKEGELSEERINESYERIVALKSRL